tara:strand:- start:161 stop:430 length:270 start_codon:yes stop_codon:yes gene_type:complete
MGKNYISGFAVTLIYLLTNFSMKYSIQLFNDFWGIDQLTNKIPLGAITVTSGFIVSLVIGIVFSVIYEKIGVKEFLNPYFQNTFLWDSD